MINPSSKMSLKMSCLQASKGNVEQAEKMFKYFADGIQSLPDFDAPKPSIIQQAKEMLNGVFGVIDSNEERIMKAYNYYQMFKGGMTPPINATPSNIPPLPNNT